MRRRPFMVFSEPTLTPEEEESLRKNGSYPSGHTLLGTPATESTRGIVIQNQQKVVRK